MFKIRHLIIGSVLLYSALFYGQFTDVINSNQPGVSMSPFSVGKTVIQAEIGFYSFKEKNETVNFEYKADGYGSDLSLRYGAFFEQLELIVNLQYQYENYKTSSIENGINSGLKKTVIGAKYLLYDPEKNYIKKPNLYSWKANHSYKWRQFIPSVGLYGGFNINLSNDVFFRQKSDVFPDKKVSPKGMIMTQNQFGNSVLVCNLIVDKFPTNTSINYVVTLTRGFSPRLSGFIEAQGINGLYHKDSFLRGGAAFLVQQNIQVDGYVATNFKETPSVFNFGVGMSWRFDSNYDEVMLRIPKEKKGNDKGKKDKKKDKAKKRLDEIGGEKTK